MQELKGLSMSGFESIPYRIRIGVTGHRKVHDPAALQALVKRAIDSEVEKLFPEESREKIERVRRSGTTAISFRVLSPLAEGADRVVARAVLAEPGAAPRCRSPLGDRGLPRRLRDRKTLERSSRSCSGCQESR